MAKATFKMVKIAALVDSIDNPRSALRDVEDLAASIKAYGLLQPLVVRPLGSDLFEIIAGHRRAAAADAAGLVEVPCVIRETKGGLAALQLVENTQRDDLRPLEIAMGVMAVMAGGRIKQKQLAAQLGKSEAWVSKFLTIGKAAEKVRAAYIKANPRPSMAAVRKEFSLCTEEECATHYEQELTYWQDDMDEDLADALDQDNAETAYLEAQHILNPAKPEKKQRTLITQPADKQPDDQADDTGKAGEVETEVLAFLEETRAKLAVLAQLVEVAPKGETGYLVALHFKTESALRYFTKQHGSH